MIIALPNNRLGIEGLKMQANEGNALLIEKEFVASAGILSIAVRLAGRRFATGRNHARTVVGEVAVILTGILDIKNAIAILRPNDNELCALVLKNSVPKECRKIKLPRKIKGTELMKVEEIMVKGL